VVVYGADRIQGQDGIWMELVEGETLRDLVAREGPLPAHGVAEIGAAVCSGLAALHAAGLVHRDVKAQNVMRDRNGRTILMDLSGGQEQESPDDGLEGTPVYLAPELLEGARATVASDIYAAGVLLFFLLTGRYPVAATSVDELRRHHRLRKAERPDAASHAVAPPSLAAAVDRALNPQPSERYSTATDFQAALVCAIAPANKPRYRRSPGAAALAFVAIVAAATWATWRPHRTAPPIPFAARDWVLVTPFENRTGDPRFDGTLDLALAQALSESGYVNIAPPERIDDALRLMRRDPGVPFDERTAREVALRDGQIRVLVAGLLARIGSAYTLTLRLVNPETGATVASRSTQTSVEVDQLLGAVQDLAAWVPTALGGAALPSTPARPLDRATTRSFEALRLYSDALAFAREERWQQVEATLASALALDPTFASAHTWMAWALLNQTRVPEAYASAERGLQLVDTTTVRERYFSRASYFLVTAQPERAVGELEALVAQYPDDYWGARELLGAYGTLGRMPEAAAAAARVAAMRPQYAWAQAELVRTVTLTRGAAEARPHAAKARQLLERYPGQQDNSDEAAYVRLFPVHDAWADGRIAEAVRLLDELEIRASDEEGDWARNGRATMRLSLGQLRRADRIFKTIRDPDLRAMFSSALNLVQNEARDAPQMLRSFRGTDLMPVSVLIRAGDIAGAERLLARLPPTSHLRWTRAELDVAATNAPEAREILREGVAMVRVQSGARAYLYSETLAEGLLKAGEPGAAIGVLEEMRAMRGSVFNFTSHTGYLWMRLQKRLADLYRGMGRIEDARRVEEDLLAQLAAGDADHPLLLELRRRGR
jgi:tRNA A-37 threonylcarbamoyl transferase component Bud32/tetratricopeptide (TPR) repeat protein